MSVSFRRRRITAVYLLLTALFLIVFSYMRSPDPVIVVSDNTSGEAAVEVLKSIPIKGRAPKTDYSREQFGNGWQKIDSCDMRNIILNRDMTDVKVDDDCNVQSGLLLDPYTGNSIEFARGLNSSSLVQIDHVVSLSDAWQKGAQLLSLEERTSLANDPLELLAVSGGSNQQKSDGDAATWLPSNKSFRCSYVARQIAVKQKYKLWMTSSERDAILRVLSQCPNQILPKP